MAIEMHHRHRAIGTVDGPQQGQGDGVVTTERDDARQRLALLRWAKLVRIGLGLAGKDAVVTLLDLVKRPAVVIPRQIARKGAVSRLINTYPCPRLPLGIGRLDAA